MPQQMIWFFVSIAFSLIAWGIVAARYIWPELRLRQRAEALRPLLILLRITTEGGHESEVIPGSGPK